MRGISSFTHSPSLPYCKFVRIRFFSLRQSFHITVIYNYYYTHSCVFFFLRVCLCIYISFCCRLIQTILPKFSAFSLLFASEHYLLFFVVFFFICSSFQMEIEKSSRINKYVYFYELFSVIVSLSLFFLLALFFSSSFDCSEMIKNKMYCYFSSVRDYGCWSVSFFCLFMCSLSL